jgi:hypothetical protein
MTGPITLYNVAFPSCVSLVGNHLDANFPFGGGDHILWAVPNLQSIPPIQVTCVSDDFLVLENSHTWSVSPGLVTLKPGVFFADTGSKFQPNGPSRVSR